MSAVDERAARLALVQRQLEAVNARDLRALLDCYHEDACQYLLPATLLAQGRAAIGARMAPRLAEPDLQARLIERRDCGSFVLDREWVTRTFEDGPGWVQLLCVYEIDAGLIRSASFAFGERLPTGIRPPV